MRDAKDKLIGTWKIVSAVMEDVETKEQKLVWGKHPNGYIILTPSGRWIVVQTAEGRKVPETDTDRTARIPLDARLFREVPYRGGQDHHQGRYSVG